MRNLQVQSLFCPNFDAEGFALMVLQPIRAEYVQTYQTMDWADEAKKILQSMKKMLEASEIVMGHKQKLLKFVLNNTLSDRHKSFRVQWTDSNVSNHSIYIRIPETYLPEFEKETRIDFVVAQGPKFLL